MAQEVLPAAGEDGLPLGMFSVVAAAGESLLVASYLPLDFARAAAGSELPPENNIDN